MRDEVSQDRLDAVRDAVQAFGGQQRMADALGVTQQTVSDWVIGRKPVPGRQALEIEDRTYALGRPVPVERLLPGWKWSVVRGRSTMEAA